MALGLYVTDGRIMLFNTLTPTGYSFREGGLPGGYNCTCLTRDAGNPNIMYAVVDGIIYKSTDAGVNWSSLSWPTGGNTALTVSASLTEPGEVWATGAGPDTFYGAYKSTDYGANWTLKYSAVDGWGNEKVVGNVVASGTRVWAAVDHASIGGGQIAVSENGGTDWSVPTTQAHANKVSMCSGNTDRGWLWQINVVVGDTKVTDDGWATNTPASPSGYIVDVMHAPDGSYSLMVRAGNIQRSTNDGTNWSEVLATPGIGVAGTRAPMMAISSDSQKVYVGGEDGKMFYSTDGGQNWDSFTIDRALDVKNVLVGQTWSANVAFKIDIR